MSQLNAEGMSEILSSFIEILNKASDLESSFLKSMNEVVKAFGDLEVSEEEKLKILELSERLADEQILVTLDEDVSLYYESKFTKASIKRLYGNYTHGKPFSKLINELKMSEFINKTYLNEAISNYRSKRYLSCCMLLLSIIDSYFLSTNKDNNGNKRKMTNKLADEKIEEVKKEKTTDFVFLLRTNTLFFLKNVFMHGKDFKREPTYLNRNYLFHGFSKRKYNMYDCLKLFILCSYLDWIA